MRGSLITLPRVLNMRLLLGDAADPEPGAPAWLAPGKAGKPRPAGGMTMAGVPGPGGNAPLMPKAGAGDQAVLAGV